MKKVLIKTKDFIIKNLLGILIGFIIAGSISIATANYAFDGSNVYYNKSNSGGSYSNVQDSITELYSKVASGNKVYKVSGAKLSVGENCSSLVFGSWKALSSASGNCYLSYVLPVSISSSVACTGEIKGNYSSTSESSSDENFRWQGGAPYSQSLLVGYTTIADSYYYLWNNTSTNSSNGMRTRCYVSNNVLRVDLNGQKATSSGIENANYGWQTRASVLTLSGYIIY